MFCIPSFFFFFSLYTLHSPPFEEQSTAESAKASQITWQIIRCNGLKLPVRCARLVFNMLTKRKQRLTCQRKKVCMRTVPCTGAFLHPIHERCVLKSCCDWLLSVRCCHLVDKEVHLSSGSVILNHLKWQFYKKKLLLWRSQQVCVWGWVLHPLSFPTSDGDLNVPRTCFCQCITAASLNICSAFSCKPVWLIA